MLLSGGSSATRSVTRTVSAFRIVPCGGQRADHRIARSKPRPARDTAIDRGGEATPIGSPALAGASRSASVSAGGAAQAPPCPRDPRAPVARPACRMHLSIVGRDPEQRAIRGFLDDLVTG